MGVEIVIQDSALQENSEGSAHAPLGAPPAAPLGTPAAPLSATPEGVPEDEDGSDTALSNHNEDGSDTEPATDIEDRNFNLGADGADTALSPEEGAEFLPEDGARSRPEDGLGGGADLDVGVDVNELPPLEGDISAAGGAPADVPVGAPADAPRVCAVGAQPRAARRRVPRFAHGAGVGLRGGGHHAPAVARARAERRDDDLRLGRLHDQPRRARLA